MDDTTPKPSSKPGPKPSADPKRRVTVRLSRHDVRLLIIAGNGNITRGVRRIIGHLLEKQPLDE